MKLKAIRKSMGHTQQKLAEMLDVNQQTVARWENGKTEPSIGQLKDLAMIYNISVDALLGKENVISRYPRYFHGPDENNKVYDDYYFGDLGIFFHEGESVRWFPVSEKVANRFISLQNEKDWIAFETLNNRYVAVNLSNITYCAVTREESDPPKHGYNATYFEKMLPDEMYRGLMDIAVYDSGSGTSEKYDSILDDYIKEHELDDNKIDDMVYHTKIYGKKKLLHDGMRADDEHLANMFHYIDLDIEENEYFHLTDYEGGNYYKFQNNSILKKIKNGFVTVTI